MLVPDAVTALMAGHVDAAAVVEPVLSRLQTPRTDSCFAGRCWFDARLDSDDSPEGSHRQAAGSAGCLP